MYKSTSSSSSSQKTMGSSHGGGLTRYGSAPGSLLTTAVDSVIGEHPSSAASLRPQHPLVNPYFSSGDSSVDSSSKIIYAGAPSNQRGLQRSYGIQELALGDLNGIGGGSSSSTSSSSLMRQRSSPAGFFTNLTAPDSNGFSVSREMGNYSSQGGPIGFGVSRLKPQLSFTRQASLSHISEVSENVMMDGIDSSIGISSNGRQSYGTTATTSFGHGSWDATNSVIFSSPQNKRSKNIEADMFGSLNVLDSQFNLPTSLEMATVLNIPEDSVPCKIRAKRGCATHPRSIAERERRTRISGKLKKLQELVPNMDKQTSYADMLDLAVQHIKGLQNQIEVGKFV